MITVTWLPNWQAYAIWRKRQLLGLVRFKYPFPFRQVVEFA